MDSVGQSNPTEAPRIIGLTSSFVAQKHNDGREGVSLPSGGPSSSAGVALLFSLHARYDIIRKYGCS
jgi:hypothetical protein